MILVEWFDSINPWIFITIGTGLILLDLLFGALFASILGGSLIINGVGLQLGLQTEIRLLTMFAFAVIGFPLYANLFMKKKTISTHETHFTFDENDTGQVIWVDPDAPHQGRAAISGKGEWIIKNDLNKSLKLNEQVQVVRRESSVLFITNKED